MPGIDDNSDHLIELIKNIYVECEQEYWCTIINIILLSWTVNIKRRPDSCVLLAVRVVQTTCLFDANVGYNC